MAVTTTRYVPCSYGSSGSSGVWLTSQPIPQGAQAHTPPHPFYLRVSRLSRRYFLDADATRDVSAEVGFEKGLIGVGVQAKSPRFLWFVSGSFHISGKSLNNICRS